MASTSLTPRTFNREELAWAAGFFDGEGHVRNRIAKLDAARTSPNPSVMLMLTISQASSPELLERVRAAIGVGAVYGPYEHRQRPNQKPFYTFTACGIEKVQHCICCLWPWLGSTKRQQAANALRSWHAQPRKWFHGVGGSRLICNRGHRVEGDNAHVTKSGTTTCRECRRIWQRNQYAKVKSGAAKAPACSP